MHAYTGFKKLLNYIKYLDEQDRWRAHASPEDVEQVRLPSLHAQTRARTRMHHLSLMHAHHARAHIHT